LCIQWILFAKQPLSPEQLYHAILSGIDLEAVTEWDPEEITKDVVTRFILDSSKGLVEATASKEQKVQFIHESVRDFLLKENGLGKIWPEFRSNFQSQSHERLKQCCFNYINIDVATPLNIPNELPRASMEEAKSLRKSATQTFPFLEYATRNVLYHADAAEGGGISQASFLDSFPLPRWVKLDNLFEKHQIRRHTEHVSLLYLLAELNMANLIHVTGSVSDCIEVGAERYGCPLFAAAAMSSEKALEVFLGSFEALQTDGDSIAATSEHQSQHKTAQRAARRDFVWSKSKTILFNAAELGHDRVLALLINSTRWQIDSRDSRGRSVLWWAFKNDCEISTRLLLAAESTMVDSKDKHDVTPLFVATKTNNIEVVRVLLEGGCNIDAQYGRYGNALYAAAARGYKEIVTLLLEKGADPNAQGGEYGNALQASSRWEYKDIVEILLENGADPNAQGGKYGNALQASSRVGHKEIVKVLLENGADPNAEGGFYGNALRVASMHGYKEVVKVLLENGADPNAQGGEYSNALQAASYSGKKEVVKVLLENGANPNAQGGPYGNALQAALAGSEAEVVAMLRQAGASEVSK
jgi:ankyrin repeat protein